MGSTFPQQPTSNKKFACAIVSDMTFVSILVQHMQTSNALFTLVICPNGVCYSILQMKTIHYTILDFYKCEEHSDTYIYMGYVCIFL